MDILNTTLNGRFETTSFAAADETILSLARDVPPYTTYFAKHGHPALTTDQLRTIAKRLEEIADQLDYEKEQAEEEAAAIALTTCLCKAA